MALAVLAMIVTGVAMATPVAALSLSDDRNEIVEPLDDGERLEYSYVQSIYLVTVVEELKRDGDRLVVLRACSSDVRALEYLRWDGEIRRDADGIFTQDAPPGLPADLVIRVTPGRRQTLRTARWTRDLDATFGDTAVRLRLDRRPRLLTLLPR